MSKSAVTRHFIPAAADTVWFRPFPKPIQVCSRAPRFWGNGDIATPIVVTEDQQPERDQSSRCRSAIAVASDHAGFGPQSEILKRDHLQTAGHEVPI